VSGCFGRRPRPGGCPRFRVLEFPGQAARYYEMAIAKRAEAEMVSETYEFQSNFSRRKIADAGDAATARAEDVLTVLEERGLPVSGEERERITGEADSGQLARWLRRAVTAAKASDLFAD
jgi:hypothetical protein